VEKEGKFWLVRDKRRFLLAVMEELAGDATCHTKIVKLGCV
jgi:hypothetical protein